MLASPQGTCYSRRTSSLQHLFRLLLHTLNVLSQLHLLARNLHAAQYGKLRTTFFLVDVTTSTSYPYIVPTHKPTFNQLLCSSSLLQLHSHTHHVSTPATNRRVISSATNFLQLSRSNSFQQHGVLKFVCNNCKAEFKTKNECKQHIRKCDR